MRTSIDIDIALPQSTTGTGRTTCPQCGSPGPHRACPGAGPHYQRLACGQCGAFLRWLPKPHGGVQEMRE